MAKVQRENKCYSVCTVENMNNEIKVSFYWCVRLAAYDKVSWVTTKRRKAPFKPVGLYSDNAVSILCERLH